MNIKEKIDDELKMICFSDDMENNIKKAISQKRVNPVYRISKVAAMFAIVFMLTGVTVFAGKILLNRINVNEDTLPELDPMSVTVIQPVSGNEDEYGFVDLNANSYKNIKDELSLTLLDSELSTDNPYMQVKLETDNADYCIINVENYILGDTSNYQLVEDVNRYNCDPGSEYYSSISLTVDLILSQEQLNTGWDTDYLGFYEYVETYVSAAGNKVNIIQDTIDDNDKNQNYVSGKCAIFVSNGIRYTLKGRVSIDTMKKIVDSMK